MKAKDEECFFVTAPKNPGTIHGNFELLSGTTDPLSIVIMDASTSRIFYRSRRGSGDGSFKISTNPGQKVNLCVQNGIFSSGRKKVSQTRQHDGLPRTVGISFTMEEENTTRELHNQNKRMMDTVQDLKSNFFRLQDHQGYTRVRESMHRETVEKTFSRLMGWNILEAVALVLVTLCQILYLRRFLERRRYI